MNKKEFRTLIAKTAKANSKTALLCVGDELMDNRTPVPTPSLRLNHLLGIGGFPRGAVTLIEGQSGAGKTTLALGAIKLALDANPDKYALICDIERSITQSYLLSVGIDPERVAVLKPDYAEAMGDIARELLDQGVFTAMLVDSIAASAPKQGFDSSMEKKNIALAARAMSIHLPLIIGPIDRNDVMALYLNQIREKPGTMFGDPEYGPGGRSPEFYANVWIRLYRKNANGDEAKKAGHITTFNIKKNKSGAGFPKGRFEIPFRHDVGFDLAEEAYDMGKEVGLVGVEEGKGPATMHFYMPGNTEDECVKVKLGRKRESHIQFLRDNPDLVNYLRGRIVEELNNQDKEA